MKQAALIFTAIPLSAIGGVFAFGCVECLLVFQQALDLLHYLELPYSTELY
jgi:hypothetical protein